MFLKYKKQKFSLYRKMVPVCVIYYYTVYYVTGLFLMIHLQYVEAAF